MKKLISIALAIMLIMSLATVAFAEDNGKITVNNTVAGQTYNIYKILDLVTYQDSTPNVNDATGAYIYQMNTAWEDFFATGNPGAEYVTVVAATDDYDSYVTWNGEKTEARVAEFAKKALAWAEQNHIDATATKTASDTTVEFTGLGLGYYLLDSSMGALCSLDTTNPNGTVSEKNGLPQVEKKVDNNGEWAESNTASIGDTVNFMVMITAKGGAENYVLHDTMEAGLTFKNDVKVFSDAALTTEIAATNYTVTTSGADGCTFEVEFNDTFAATLEDSEVIYVTYSATLNENAEVAGDSNDNSVKLTYGDDQKVEDEEVTKTYTYEFELVKTDGDNKLLDGAEFKLYGSADGNDEIKVVQVGNNYEVNKAAATGATIVVKDGKVVISGLGNGTYYLEETKAPAGYNELKTRKSFTIDNSNMVATLDASHTTYVEGGVQVVNKTGSELPETGAMGTAIFVSFGTMVVLGTGVLLVTKKRMSMIED